MTETGESPGLAGDLSGCQQSNIIFSPSHSALSDYLYETRISKHGDVHGRAQAAESRKEVMLLGSTAVPAENIFPSFPDRRLW